MTTKSYVSLALALSALPMFAFAQGQTMSPEPISQPTAPAMSANCPLLSTFISIGGNNNPAEVTKLQTFLRDTEHADVDVNGIYDDKTVAAVKNFQLLYAAVILQPYGTTVPTGNIFVTTQHVLNQVACQKETPLSAEESAQVAAVAERYRSATQASTMTANVSTAAPTPESEPVTVVATAPTANAASEEDVTIPAEATPANLPSNGVVADNDVVNMVVSVPQGSLNSRFWAFMVQLFSK